MGFFLHIELTQIMTEFAKQTGKRPPLALWYAKLTYNLPLHNKLSSPKMRQTKKKTPPAREVRPGSTVTFLFLLQY